MFNHSTNHQNVGWRRDAEHQVVVYAALRDIKEGEELCISYGAGLWFPDADHEPGGGGDEDGVADGLIANLNKIDL